MFAASLADRLLVQANRLYSVGDGKYDIAGARSVLDSFWSSFIRPVSVDFDAASKVLENGIPHEYDVPNFGLPHAIAENALICTIYALRSVNDSSMDSAFNAATHAIEAADSFMMAEADPDAVVDVWDNPVMQREIHRQNDAIDVVVALHLGNITLPVAIDRLRAD
jgi:uncharacterized protein YjaG (DUF416 family)